jgi:hypothetical protein
MCPALQTKSPAPRHATGRALLPPTLDDDLGFSARAELFEAEAFIAEFAVEASPTPFCQGLPGATAVSMPCAAMQHKTALDTNSGQ